MDHDQWKYLRDIYKEEEVFRLMRCKGVCPYEYMNSWRKFISDEDYEYPQQVWNTITPEHENIALGDYHDVYLARDVPQQTFAWKMSWRSPLSSSSEDVFKTSWSRRKYTINLYVFRRRLQDVFKTSSKRLDEDQIIVLVIRLQDVFRTYCQDVFKTSSRRLEKTSSRHLQDVFKMFSRRLQDIFKTYSRRLQDVFKTSLRRPAKISSRCFQNVSSSQTVLVNTFLKNVSE